MSARAGLAWAIFAAWPDFRGAMASQLAAPKAESRALSYVYVASLIGFIASLPEVARQAETDELPLTALVIGRLFSALFFAPLFLYGVAALSHLVAKRLGGQGSYYDARLALFWALLVAAPLLLAVAILQAVLAAGPAYGAGSVLSLIGFAGFLWIWAACLSEAEGFVRSWVTAAVLAGISVALTVAFMTILP